MSKDPGVEAWKSETTAFDRVQSIAMCLDEPQGAGAIAEAAHVAENTARSHLSRLADLGLVQSSSRDEMTVYYPDPLYTRMRTLRDLLNEHDREGLMELRASLQDAIEGWRTEYGVEGPSALRSKSAGAETAAETREYAKTASDWELALYRLSVVSEAIENYETYTVSPLDGEAENQTSSLPVGAHEDLPGDAFYDLIGEELEAALDSD